MMPEMALIIVDTLSQRLCKLAPAHKIVAKGPKAVEKREANRIRKLASKSVLRRVSTLQRKGVHEKRSKGGQANIIAEATVEILCSR
jgi:hypothetical protein